MAGFSTEVPEVFISSAKHAHARRRVNNDHNTFFSYKNKAAN
jgi:hypothetical protein